MSFSIRRTIEIDMGHRVPTHGSKCWNLHGHRYVIEAEVRSIKLQTKGVETGMVVDFGFLKQFMMSQIHDFCDHGLCLWVRDPVLNIFMSKNTEEAVRTTCDNEGWSFIPERKDIGQFKMLVVPFVPTAEHLAEFWFSRLRLPIEQHNPNVRLARLYVWETPNSVAIFPSHATVEVSANA
jgi:6-pyruvoyltetrahydropterin/6-carboxytetrahydropterin synthase